MEKVLKEDINLPGRQKIKFEFSKMPRIANTAKYCSLNEVYRKAELTWSVPSPLCQCEASVPSVHLCTECTKLTPGQKFHYFRFIVFLFDLQPVLYEMMSIYVKVI